MKTLIGKTFLETEIKSRLIVICNKKRILLYAFFYKLVCLFVAHIKSLMSNPGLWHLKL